MQILLASNNHHKRQELEKILVGHQLMTPHDVGVEFDYEETADTFIENAIGKARTLFNATRGVASGTPVIADDSGLCVRALDNRPGVRSARYGSPDGGATELPSPERNRLLLGELDGAEDRSAFFVCCMVAVFSDDRLLVVQETFEGAIAANPSGVGGFGYDPIFSLPERGCTVAELPDAEKNRISHRGKAAAALARALQVMGS